MASLPATVPRGSSSAEITIKPTQASLPSVAEVTKLLQRICQATARTCLCL